MRRDAVFVGAAVTGSPEVMSKRLVANCLSPSAAKNDNESCPRQFEHLCRGPSLSSEERLLDPAGEGEDILKNQQQSTVLTIMQGEGKGR